MCVVGREEGGGYEGGKIWFNVWEWWGIGGYLLVGEGKGGFGGVIMVEDDGGEFWMGKEKMVGGLGVCGEIWGDGEDWVVGCYEGEYRGD